MLAQHLAPRPWLGVTCCYHLDDGDGGSSNEDDDGGYKIFMKIFILLKFFSDYQIYTYSKKTVLQYCKDCITSVGRDVEQELSYVTTKDIN